MAAISHIDIPWSCWNDVSDLRLEFPPDAKAELLAPDGLPAWSARQICEAITAPINCRSLREQLTSNSTICIAVDDMARPTRAGDVLPHVINELTQAGISPQQCSIVVATGTHGAPSESDIAKKVGPKTIEWGAHITTHTPDQLSGTGIVYGKRELFINSTFMKADFKLGISSVLPHSFAGFSGGAKMMLPGLADIDATARSHKFVQMGLRSGGSLDNNRFRLEIESLARQLGFEFTICVITNQRHETAGVYAGDIVSAHRAACDAAQNCYRTPYRGQFDAVVLNAFPKDGDLIQAENAMIAFKQSRFTPVRESGLIVLCTAAKDLGAHGLFSPEGISYRRPVPNRALGSRQLWIYAPNLDESTVRQRYWDGYPHFRKSDSLIRELQRSLGDSARIGVLPCAPMQQLIEAV